MNALSTITVMPETKEALALYTSKVKEEILSGYENPLKIAKLLKSMEEIIDWLRSDKEIRDMIIREAGKYSEKTIREFGAEFQIKESGTKYDYSGCDDAVLIQLKKEQEKINQKVKEREAFLKNITDDTFDENGIKLNRPVKTSQTIVTVTLK